METQRYHKPGEPLSANMQAQLYYARKRARARAEATAGDGGGLREQKASMGIHVDVVLTTQ